MSYVNLPDNLRDIIYTLSDRVTKLETGPNAAAYTADDAKTTANAASATAVAAQTTATGAQTTADGKNTVHYSSSTPGSTANVAGDLWFQFNGSNNIIGQWTGQGGTTWQANQITSTVIANLDAGKITTGSLDASLVTVTTSPTALNAITFSGANTSIDFYQNVVGVRTSIAHILPLSSYGILMHYGASPDPGGGSYPQMYVGSSNVSMFANSTHGISVNTTQASVTGSLYVSSQFEVQGNLQIDTMATVASPTSANYNTVLISKTSTGATLGRLYGYNNLSSIIYKENITDFVNKDYLGIVNKMRPVTFNYKADQVIDPESIVMGMIAEDIDAIPGAQDLIEYVDEKPSAIRYDKIPLFLIKAIQEISTRLEKLEGNNGSTSNG